MNQTFTAVIEQDGPSWMGWIEELFAVSCREPSRDEPLESLRVTLAEPLAMHRADAREATDKSHEEFKIAV